MGPVSVYNKSTMVKVKEWIDASKELFIELYRPHSGGAGTWYLVSSYTSFNEMVAKAPSGAVLFILRQPQFPIRGIVDDAFVDRACNEIQDGEWYTVTQCEFYPAPLPSFGSGNSHVELKADLEDCRGMPVCLGKEPNVPIKYWVENDDEDVIIACKP